MRFFNHGVKTKDGSKPDDFDDYVVHRTSHHGSSRNASNNISFSNRQHKANSQRSLSDKKPQISIQYVAEPVEQRMHITRNAIGQ